MNGGVIGLDPVRRDFADRKPLNFRTPTFVVTSGEIKKGTNEGVEEATLSRKPSTHPFFSSSEAA
jgi:hypothetical protein